MLHVIAYLRKDGETLSAFKAQWARLSAESKAELKAGVTNETYTY